MKHHLIYVCGDDSFDICVVYCSLNISGWAQMIAIGFMAATRYTTLICKIDRWILGVDIRASNRVSSVRVSNELGRRNAGAAKFATLMAVATSISIALLLLALFLIYRDELAYVFTRSEEVAGVVARMSPLLAYTLLLNGVQPVLSGVATGTGRQVTVTYVNLGSYYLIGIPLAFVLGFVLELQVQVSVHIIFDFFHICLVLTFFYPLVGRVDRDDNRVYCPNRSACYHDSRYRLG